MYTCPEKDIHSIYVDNELPAAYCGDYESHIKSCPKCAAELKKMQAIHENLRMDAASHTPDEHFVEESFSRLQTRMSYSKVTKTSRHTFAFSTLKLTVPATAAAAVFALLFVPLSWRGAAAAEKTAMQTITRASLKPIAKNAVIVDGNISHTSLASLFSAKETKPVATASSMSNGGAIAGATTASTSTRGSSILNNAVNEPLASVDVFRPDFTTHSASVSIKITFPSMDIMTSEADATMPPSYITGPDR